MGIGEVLKNMVKGVSQAKKGSWQKCPNCGERVSTDMERCPKCSVHIKSMFRMKCPKCEALNELDAKKCTKCGYDFEAELRGAERTVYICPICGYKMGAFMTACPACNTRFV